MHTICPQAVSTVIRQIAGITPIQSPYGRALPEILDRASVDKALVDLTNRLSSVDGKRPTRTGRPAPARRRHQIVVESFSLFS